VKIKETELYEPIKKLLESHNLTVKGEVKNCDIAALLDDELWIVEMKLSLSMTLLCQAVRRLSLSPYVFVAVPRPKRSNNKNFKTAQAILKNLGLGLITVALDSPTKFAEIIFYPQADSIKTRKNPKKSAALRKEIEGRTGDTPGGSTRRTIMTAYRERCIKIACFLAQHEVLSPKQLKQMGCEEDAGNILRSNNYGWFSKISLGKYSLSAAGRLYLAENSENVIVAEYSKFPKNS